MSTGGYCQRCKEDGGGKRILQSVAPPKNKISESGSRSHCFLVLSVSGKAGCHIISFSESAWLTLGISIRCRSVMTRMRHLGCLPPRN